MVTPGVKAWAQPAQGGSEPIDTTVPVADQPPAPPSAGGSGTGFFDWLTGSSTASSGGIGAPGATDSMGSTASAGSAGASSQGGPQDPSLPNPDADRPAAPPRPSGGGGLSMPGSAGSAGSTGTRPPEIAIDPDVGGAATSLGGLTGRAGVAYASVPDYFGADTGRELFEPFFDMTFGANGFLNNDDGLGFTLLSLGALETKVSVNQAYGQRFEGATEGLSALSRYSQAELDVTYQTLAQTYELELAVPLSGPDGWTLTGSVAQAGPLATFGTWDARLGVTYASKDWMVSYYGIPSDEASASGLAVYDPDGGLRDIFIETGADFPLGAAWGVDVGAGGRYVLGQAQDSPQVSGPGSKTDYFGHLAVYYRF